MQTITVHSGHTPQMLEQESLAMEGKTPIPVTLGDVMALHRARSPFIFGGELTEGDCWEAYRLLKDRWQTDPWNHRVLSGSDLTEADDWDKMASEALMEFARDLEEGLSTAWRAWEIIAPMPDAKPRNPAEDSDVEMYSPEWQADIIIRACAGMPSLTYDQCLHTVPLAMLIHLGNAVYRYNGGRTLRDHGEREAIAILRRMQEERRKKQEADNHA